MELAGWTDVEVCIDCMLAAGGAENDAAPDRDRWGLWRGDGRVTAVVLDGEPWFSWTPCDGCGSTLGGLRYACTVRVDPRK